MNRLTLIFFLIIAFILLKHLCKAQCHFDDWTALKALYESTNGGNWLRNAGWEEVIGNAPNNNCNLENLDGVILDANGRVYQLNMVYNRLNGVIPPDLGNLSNLERLDIGNNKLRGSIPPELGNLSNLDYFRMYGNQLSDSIPPELGNLSKLTYLNLGNNQLSDSIPPELGNLINLTFLALSDNQHSGGIPPELGNLTNLETFYLNNNELSGCYDVNLLNLSAGTNKSVSQDNSFDAPWEVFRYSLDGTGACNTPDYGNCFQNDSLILINLYMNTAGLGWSNTWDLNKPLNSWYGVTLNGFGCVTKLELNDNKLSGNIPSDLGNLNNLLYLNLHSNQLRGSIPIELGNLSNLKELSLSSNHLSDSIPHELGNLSNLRYLSLYSNDLIGSIPCELGSLSNLTDLYLFNNELNGFIPPSLGNLNNLGRLYLYNNQLSGNIPPEIGNLSKLTWLRINDNSLSGCYPSNMSIFCTQLTNSLFNGNTDITNGNNFDTTWEGFCANGYGSCILGDSIVAVATHHSGNVTISLNNNQNILKNKVATVYDYYSTCTDYTDISNCNPVEGFNNKSANEALWAVTEAANYFKSKYDVDIPHVNIVVNSTKSSDINTAYYSQSDNLIVLGSGNGTIRDSMSAPDIVAHEYTHHLIKNILNEDKLLLWGEFGALNESFADIFGEMVEYYAKDTNDWIIGSDVMPSDSEFNGLRNFKNPRDSNMEYPQPDTYKKVNWKNADPSCNIIDDQCGIHTNSGVQNYWFYLLSEGGSDTNDNGNNYQVLGITKEKAAQIAFKNLNEYFTPSSTYEDVALGSINAAMDLFGANSNEVLQTKAAWNAIGVPIENPITWHIKDIIISPPINNRYPTSFSLAIDSLNKDISADGLQFTLHTSEDIEDLTIVGIHPNLTWAEVDTSLFRSENTISINRQSLQALNRNSNGAPRIASRQSIVYLTGCIIEIDIGSDPTTLAPIDITGGSFVHGTLKEFEQRSLSFALPSNTIGLDGQNWIPSIGINNQTCSALGAIEIDVLNGAIPFNYVLKNIDNNTTIYAGNIESLNIQLYGLSQGIYEFYIADEYGKNFTLNIPINFIAQSDGNDCCPNKLLVTSDNNKGIFQAKTEIDIRGYVNKLSTTEFIICE